MNTAPWPSPTGPSLTGAHFYTPGWSPRCIQKPAPKPSPLNPPKPLDAEAVRAYRATHTLEQTAAHFDCSPRHLNRRYPVKIEVPQVDRMEVHAYRMSGKSLRDCASKFHMGERKLAKLLEGLPKLQRPDGKPRFPGVRRPKLATRYYVYLNAEQRAKIAAHGGAVWVRALIDQHKEAHAF